ncbi:hypothetical protein AADZ90_018430 [Aestuariibius sp. 2305UL40-4]|uniref:PIN-like domain-containing protein n=1 Tax=Aestuariibius violaceus TaxID=3234132 RepID=UPI00345E44FF
MKVIVDENLPPALAHSLAALFADLHVVIHLRDRFGPKVEDTEWIRTLSSEGRWIVISGDRRISRNKAEQQVFRSSNLIGFFLARSLQKSSMTKQMERLMAFWPNIEQQAELVSGGSMFEIPIKTLRLKTI